MDEHAREVKLLRKDVLEAEVQVGVGEEEEDNAPASDKASWKSCSSTTSSVLMVDAADPLLAEPEVLVDSVREVLVEVPREPDPLPAPLMVERPQSAVIAYSDAYAE